MYVIGYNQSNVRATRFHALHAEKSFDNMPLQYVYIIDQAQGQDGWILAEFSFRVFMDRDEVEVQKNVKRERGQYPAILTELAWSIKDLLTKRSKLR